MESKKRAPKTVKPFYFVNDPAILYAEGVDLIKGLGAIVLSVLRARKANLWNSRELAEAIAKHPDFSKSKQTPERVANTWIFKLKAKRLIRDAK